MDVANGELDDERSSPTPSWPRPCPKRIVETLQMVGISAFFTVLIGLPLGVFLHVTAPGRPARRCRSAEPDPVSDVIVNITRSIPFAILMVALIPLPGPDSSAPRSARSPPRCRCPSAPSRSSPGWWKPACAMCTTGKIDAAQVMGSTRCRSSARCCCAKPCPASSRPPPPRWSRSWATPPWPASIGGGGLGRLAYNYGFQRFDTTVMIVTIVIMVILVQLIQLVGDRISAPSTTADAPAPDPGASGPKAEPLTTEHPPAAAHGVSLHRKDASMRKHSPSWPPACRPAR